METNDKKKIILDRSGLQKELRMKGLAGKLISGLLYKILELKKVNATTLRYSDQYGPDFAASVIKDVGAAYELDPSQLDNIPSEGGFITVSNHHYGSIDGMILTDVVVRKRPDYKILTTFLLARIPNLRDWFIPVNNISAGDTRTVSGIRAALGHIGQGSPLGLFPAGEVGTWQKKQKRTAVQGKWVVEDKPWAENMMKLIRRSGFPVVPIFFDGGNSLNFHLLGQIHPRLRTVRLPHELYNKQGHKVHVVIGKPIPADEIARFSDKELSQYLHNRCYALEEQCLEKSAEAAPAKSLAPLAEAVSPDAVRSRMESLRDKMLFESGDYRVYLLSEQDAPEVMQEVYRLREETFRSIGEGSGKSLDTDPYDKYYRHMLLWSVPGGEIVGGYRIGFGSEIMASHGGLKGFYSASLVKMGPRAEEIFSQSIELGRSFIRKEYQREVLALKMMLAGICVLSTQDSSARYFTGPVSISNSFPDFYKSLTACFLQQHYALPHSEEIARPSHAFKPDYMRVNPEQLFLQQENDIDSLNRLIGNISDGRYRLPVLMRKYFSNGARVICFNVDPLFSNSLDCHILLPLKEYPVASVRSYVRALPQELQEAVFLKFYGTVNP
jgi:putative hemolysin